MKPNIFTNGAFATLIVLFMIFNAAIGAFSTVGCTSKGFDTCLDRGNHCNLQDLVGTCHQCTCFTGIGATATTTVDYGCAAVQVGLVTPLSFCPKVQRDVYHPTKVTLADLDNIKVIDPEAWFVLARLVLEQQQHGLKAVRAITATGVPISQIPDGQVQVPYTVTTTVCTTSTPVVITVNTTTKTSTVSVVSGSSIVPQTYNVSQTYEIPQTYGVPTPAVSSTYSSITIQSVSTPAFPESPTLSVVQSVPTYPVGPQVPQVPANGSTTHTRAITVSFVSSVTTLYLSLVPSVTTEATVPTTSVGSPSYGVPTTYGVNTTVTTPTLTASVTTTPTPTGGASFCSLGAEAVALVAAVGFALI